MDRWRGLARSQGVGPAVRRHRNEGARRAVKYGGQSSGDSRLRLGTPESAQRRPRQGVVGEGGRLDGPRRARGLRGADVPAVGPHVVRRPAAGYRAGAARTRRIKARTPRWLGGASTYRVTKMQRVEFG